MGKKKYGADPARGVFLGVRRESERTWSARLRFGGVLCALGHHSSALLAARAVDEAAAVARGGERPNREADPDGLLAELDPGNAEPLALLGSDFSSRLQRVRELAAWRSFGCHVTAGTRHIW